MSGTLTRRSVVGLLSVATMVSAASREEGASGTGPARDPDRDPRALRAGVAFGRWVIAEAHPVELGAMRVEVLGRDGERFGLDVVARDPGSPRPPAEVGELAIYLCNGGDGWSPTVEEHGLAAMALASLLERRGATAKLPGLLSQAERLTIHRAALT